MEAVTEKQKLQKYPVYKDSGVDWLGKIPANWEILPLYAVAKIRSEKNYPDLELLSVYLDLGVIRFNDVVEKRTNVTSLDLSNYQKVQEGDFVLNNQQAWRGSVGVSVYNGIISPAYIVLKLSSKLFPHFANYLFRNSATVSQYLISSRGVGTIQRNLYWPQLRRTNISIPSINEQTAIANFLDEKCGKIDTAIGQKQQLIELLKERKQIIIQNAVTKGLDPEVKMKDSGVEWIGEIPEHWEVKRFRNVFSLGKGLTITKENLIDSGIPCLNYGEIHSKFGFELDVAIHNLKYVDEEYLASNPNSLIGEGDFVFADTSEDIEGSGNFTYIKNANKLFAGYHTVIAKPKFVIESRFFAYQFDSKSFRNQIRTLVKGVKVYSITQSILKQPSVWDPPIKEQLEIIEYLDNKCSKISKAIDFQIQQIEKLKEYKSSLIDAAVTGKIKVS